MMDPIRLWGTAILSIMAAGAVVAGVMDLMTQDDPVFRLNGPAGTLLIAPALLAIIARFWHRIRSINWGEKSDTTLSFAEPWLNHFSTVTLGICLIAFGALGFIGYQGKTIELVFDGLLLVVGLGLLAHKLRNGRAMLVLSPVGLIRQRGLPIAWDRVVSSRMSRMPWSSEIVIEIRPTGAMHAAGDKIKILPTLIGADPVDLLRAIEMRRTEYTF